MRGRAVAAGRRGRWTILVGALSLVVLAAPAAADRAAPTESTTTTTAPPTDTTATETTVAGAEPEPPAIDAEVEITEVEVIEVDEFEPGPPTTTVPIDDAPPDAPPDEPGGNAPDDGAPGETDAPAQPLIADEFGFAMEIHAGVRSVARAGHAVPVAIEIAAQRLITGELRVVAATGARSATTAQTIEVPGSSTKRFVVVAPVAMGGFDDLRVQLELEGEIVVDHPVTVTTDPTVEIVGVMALVAAPDSLPDTADLAIDVGTASLVGLDAETLGAGLGALDTFDTIVASAADLDSLAGREFDALSAWVSAGGHLVVDEVGGPVPRLPEDWQPTADRARTAGRGLVRFSDGAAKVGEWETVLLPTPVDDASEARGFDLRSLEDPAGALDAVLSDDAGFSLPRLLGILILLAAYAVVVGPLSFVLLRRRGRTERMWATVPALAAIATIGVVLLGADLRDNTSASHLTVVVTGAGTDVATTHVLVDSGEAGIRLPRGWTGRVDASAEGGPDAHITTDGEEGTARLDLASGAYGRISATGPVERHGLEVEATSDGTGRVDGRVVNRAEVTLHDVAVLTSTYGQSFGSLQPGEAREFSLRGVDGFELRPDAAALLWASSRLAEIGAWEGVFDDRGGVNGAPIGGVTAVGWTDRLSSPVETATGGTIRSGRTVLVAHQAITGTADANMAARLEIVRGPDGATSGLQATYQGVIGWTDDVERLAVTVPRFAEDLAVWNGTRWQSISTTGSESTRQLRTEDVVVDGIIHFRLTIDRRQIFEFANGRTLTVGPVVDGEGEGDA